MGIVGRPGAPFFGHGHHGIHSLCQQLPKLFRRIALSWKTTAHADDGNRFRVGAELGLQFLDQSCRLLEGGKQLLFA
jgi:hypothetical protein